MADDEEVVPGQPKVSPDILTVHCEDPEKILAVMCQLMPKLTRDVGMQFLNITMTYFQRYGKAGAHQRLNGRTISEVIAQYSEDDDLPVIASGEVDGVRYELRDAPLKPGNASNTEASE